MIFAQMNRYARTRLTFSPDDRQGASVAHADLLRAIAKHGSVESIELYTSGPPKQAPAMNLEFAELCREFPNRHMRLRNFDELETLPEHPQRVFYTSGVFVAPLAQLRRSLHKKFPICALSHALDFPLGQFFPGALLPARECDTIITSSVAGKVALHRLREASEELAAAQFGHAVPLTAPRIDVIPLGVDMDTLYPRDQAVSRQMLDLPKEEIILLYLGRLSEEHKADLEPLFIVLRELRRKHSNVSLLIAGHDPENSYYGELDSLAVRLGIRNHIRFFLNFQDFLKPAIYSASDILISPIDNIQETFGLSIIEAMACGLPVVASDWSGYRELVVHGRTGFLIPTMWNPDAVKRVSRQAPMLIDGVRRHIIAQQTIVLPSAMHQYLDELVGNAELRKEFGSAGTARVRNEFCWRKVIGMHEALWNELWETISRCDTADPGGLLDDWDLVFRHFASQCVSPDMMVKRSSLRSDMADALRFRPAKPGYMELDPEQFRGILERTSVFPATVRELVEDGVATTETIVWLLKKGYLRFVDPAQS